MLPTRNSPLLKYLKPGAKEGEPNFSIEKSDYIPTNTVFDTNESFFNMAERISPTTGEDLNINKYFNVRISRLNTGNTIEAYKRYRINFNDRVAKLDQSEIYFDTSYANSRGYTREFKQFSYTRAFEGKAFDCLGYRFGGLEKTLLVEGNDTIRYVFTLKTKYIRELQTALLKGKSLKSHWFTVFITPTIPVVSHSKGFSKPFRTRFITPFEESGIEIIYMDDILNELSFTHVDKFKFSFAATKRTDRALEMEQTVLEFRKYELNKIQLQEDWDMGIASKIRFVAWKTTVKAIYVKDAYIEYIDEVYYKGIPLVEGMMRELQIGEQTIELQIYKEQVGWTTPEVLDAQNPLTLIFRIFPELNNTQLPNLSPYLFEQHPTIVKTVFFGDYKDYKEGNKVLSFKDDSYYEIKEFKAEIKHLSVECPNVIEFENTLYTYHTGLKAYGTNYDLHREKFETIDTSLPLYITTISEFVNDSEHFSNNCILYFYDIKTLCVKINNLLHSIDTENLWDMENYLTHNLVNASFFSSENYDEMTIRVMLNNLTSSALLPMQNHHMHSNFHLRYGNEKPPEEAPVGEDSPVLDFSDESLTTEISMEEQLDSAMNDSNDAIDEEGLPTIQQISDAENVMSQGAREFVDSAINGPIHEPEGVISMEEAHASAREEAAAEDARDRGEAERLAQESDNRRAEDEAEDESDEPDASIFDVPVVAHVETDEEYEARVATENSELTPEEDYMENAHIDMEGVETEENES